MTQDSDDNEAKWEHEFTMYHKALWYKSDKAHIMCEAFAAVRTGSVTRVARSWQANRR